MSAIQTAVQVEVADPRLREWVLDAAVEAGTAVVADGADIVVADSGALDPQRHPTRAWREGVALVVVGGYDADSDALWRTVSKEAGHAVVLPTGSAWLVQLFRWAAATAAGHPHALSVVVVGSRGGAGATTLSAGLAAAGDGSAVVVDGDPAAAGLDIAAGVDGAAGIRWQDLAGIRGPVAGSALRGRLPSSGAVEWLATPVGTPNAASWQPVLSSLAAVFDTVVVDLPRYRLTATPPPPGAVCVLLSTLDTVSLSTAATILESGRLGADPVVAIRTTGGPLRMSTAAEALSGYRLVEVPTSRSLRGAMDFGDLPEAAARGAFGRACQRLMQELRP